MKALPDTDQYIGDGVYASFDGYGVILDLRAENDTTRVYLEPEVFARLVEYRDHITAAHAKKGEAA